MFRDLLKRGVNRGEDGEVGSRAVQELDQLFILIDEFGELCGIFRLSDQLIYCHVGFPMMRRVMRFAMVRTMVRRSMMGWFVK